MIRFYSVMRMHGLLRRLSYALLPAYCTSCRVPLHDDPVPFFCRRCWSELQPLSGPCCPRCGRPFVSPHALAHSPSHTCSPCRRRPPSYTRAWSLYRYDGPLEDAIKLFKYHNKVALRWALADLLAEKCHEFPAVDVVMPVPLHASRLREREYNQSLLLATRTAGACNVSLSYDNLIRIRETVPQTALRRRLRLNNLRRAFSVCRPREIAGKRVLLVDDVFTTGTTVNECAKALRKAGASDVYVATLARTV